MGSPACNRRTPVLTTAPPLPHRSVAGCIGSPRPSDCSCSAGRSGSPSSGSSLSTFTRCPDGGTSRWPDGSICCSCARACNSSSTVYSHSRVSPPRQPR
jgi:hypothetical protein